MTEMTHLRALTSEEIAELERRGNTSSSWAGVRVSEDFAPAQLSYSHFDGEVTIASGVRIYRSRVANYHIGEGTIVDTVTALECRARTSFGNGVEVAAMNNRHRRYGYNAAEELARKVDLHADLGSKSANQGK